MSAGKVTLVGALSIGHDQNIQRRVAINASGKFLAALLAAVFAFSPPSAGAAECEAFPTVRWWGAITHDSITKYVDRRYNGDFAPYIDMWEKQLNRLRVLHERGKVAIVKGVSTDREGNSKKYSVRMRDEQLVLYITNVEKRLKILNCLALDNPAGVRPAKLAQIPVFSDAQMVAAGLKAAKTAGCFRCHGEKPIKKFNHIPNLAGQNVLYLVRQLIVFRAEYADGLTAGPSTRQSAIMRHQPHRLSDDDLWSIAAYFSKLGFCSQEGRRYAGTLEPKLAHECISCHGAEGTSVFPEVPNLAAQSYEYLLRQLRAFRASIDRMQRDYDLNDSRYHYFMSRVLQKFTDFDLSQIAEYYASLTCPSK
ncbi:MAG: c-type cytochrome [Rhodospirillales bacterium]|nr:c-type cytochrome [Rhodospirillales bacterium]